MTADGNYSSDEQKATVVSNALASSADAITRHAEQLFSDGPSRGHGPSRTSKSQVTNALTFDLEHWHSATLLRDAVDDPCDEIHESVEIVRDVLEKHDVTATFFVVGEVAREYPDLIADLKADGHEIGSHGHTHTPLSELDAGSFRRELDESVDAIRDATGERPRGFRAPNFSVGPDTEWAFDVLDDAGFRYDASVFPVRTPMYGVSQVPIEPYRVDSDNPFVPGDGELFELPAAVSHPRFRLPIAGGFYARILPVDVLKWGIRELNRLGVPATLYFHPWEFNPTVKMSALPLHSRFISFHGIERTRTKLGHLLSEFPFGPSRDALPRT